MTGTGTLKQHPTRMERTDTARNSCQSFLFRPFVSDFTLQSYISFLSIAKQHSDQIVVVISIIVVSRVPCEAPRDAACRLYETGCRVIPCHSIQPTSAHYILSEALYNAALCIRVSVNYALHDWFNDQPRCQSERLNFAFA